MDLEQLIIKTVEGISNTNFSLVGVFLFSFFVFFWVVVVGWVWVDSGERTSNWYSRVGAAGLVALLNILGLIIYLIVRPKQTIQELYWADLERRYLKYETTELGDCPSCGFSLQPGFNVCPKCRYGLKQKCDGCEIWVDKSYVYCPFCGSSMAKTELNDNAIGNNVVMEEAVNKSRTDAIKAVEGNKTKYVDRHGVISKVRADIITFIAKLKSKRKKTPKIVKEKPIKKKVKRTKKKK